MTKQDIGPCANPALHRISNSFLFYILHLLNQYLLYFSSRTSARTLPGYVAN